jgi:hypothetical protein
MHDHAIPTPRRLAAPPELTERSRAAPRAGVLDLAPSNQRARPAWMARWADRYLLFLVLVLVGYALGGRGFAYFGLPPLFIGEVALLLGVGALLLAQGWTRIFQTPALLALTPFLLLGICRTMVDLPDYHIDAVRDAAIYYYAAFAMIVGGLIVSEPRRLMTILQLYRRFVPIFLIGIPIVALVYRGLHDSLPRWPWTDGPIIQEKEGDVMVQLAGILAFWNAGLAGEIALGWAALLAVNAAVLGQVDRAGLLSFGSSIGLGFFHRPKGKLGWYLIGGVVAAVLVLAVTNVHIEIPGGKGRELSFDQVKLNLTSITGDAGLEGMDSTKEWRTSWWTDIINDNLTGRHRWTGRGFGINLADEYGYQVQSDHSLRSPHNAHMTVLARMGAPGLALWAALQITWIFCVGRAYWKSRRANGARWRGVFFFLGAFWLAFLINASFDVYLEGPMGGIWFWSVFGVGAAATWVYERRPEVMYQN